jgi:hypothetical protein
MHPSLPYSGIAPPVEPPPGTMGAVPMLVPGNASGAIGMPPPVRAEPVSQARTKPAQPEAGQTTNGQLPDNIIPGASGPAVVDLTKGPQPAEKLAIREEQPAQTTQAAPRTMDPDLGMTLMRVGLSLMQPIQPNETAGTRIAQAGLGGIDYLEQRKAARRAEARAGRREKREERQLDIQEESVRQRGRTAQQQLEFERQKHEELTGLEKAKAEADRIYRRALAQESRARARLYDRTPGTGSSTAKPKTQADLRFDILKNADYSLISTPEELDEFLAHVDQTVARSGLPTSAQAAVQPPAGQQPPPPQPSGGKPPPPPNWQEAVKQLKQYKPNMTEQERLQYEGVLKQQYPDYPGGQL